MSANLNIRNGKVLMAYVGETPWHRTGVQLPEDCDWHTMMQAAGIDRVNAEFVNLYAGDSHQPLENYRGIADAETREVWTVVGKRYEIVQYRDAFTLPQALVDEGLIRPHTAGILGTGEKAWALFEVAGPEGSGFGHSGVTRNDGGLDPWSTYLMAWAAHDGTSAVLYGGTQTRVVCQNTANLALGARGSKLRDRIACRHTASVTTRIAEAHQLLENIIRARTEQEALFGSLDQIAVSREQAVVTFNAWLDDIRGEIDETALNADQLRRAREGRMAEVETLFHLFERGAGNRGETAYDALNAITDYVDHAKRRAQKAEARFQRLMLGAGAEAKRRAVTRLVALRDGRIQRERRIV